MNNKEWNKEIAKQKWIRGRKRLTKRQLIMTAKEYLGTKEVKPRGEESGIADIVNSLLTGRE